MNTSKQTCSVGLEPWKANGGMQLWRSFLQTIVSEHGFILTKNSNVSIYRNRMGVQICKLKRFYVPGGGVGTAGGEVGSSKTLESVG